MKLDKINWSLVILWIFVYLGLFAFGVISGMFYQQKIIETGIISVLTYTDLDIDINFNETKFVEELNKTVIPPLKEIFNETIGEKSKEVMGE